MEHMMTLSKTAEKMIAYLDGDTHEICHFMAVWSYASLIGTLEGLCETEQHTLELAAIVYDIACPLCRRKYGHASGAHQEKEGGPLARDFLQECGYPEDIVNRVAFLVAHHHTYYCVEGMDWQILLEADLLVNAAEQNYSKERVKIFADRIFRTKSGIRLVETIYGNDIRS